MLAPAPPLLPPEVRSVSYGLHDVPPQLLRIALPPTNAVFGLASPLPLKLTSEAMVTPEMMLLMEIGRAHVLNSSH